MYYLTQSYSDQIIICNPNNDIIARIMHYDFKSEELALAQAEELVNLLNQSTTTDTEPKGEFVNDGSDYQLLDYVFSPFNTDEGFTNIEVEDFEGNYVGEIAGVEIPDEYDKEEVIKFEEILIAWLKGEGLL